MDKITFDELLVEFYKLNQNFRDFEERLDKMQQTNNFLISKYGQHELFIKKLEKKGKKE